MAPNENTQSSAESPTAPEGDGPLSREGVAGGLSQIQRILVEPRIQQVQAALEALDRRRQKELADLRAELDRAVARSDDFIKKEAAILGEAVTAEKRERSQQTEGRAHELEARLEALEDRLGKLEERLTAETRELRQAALDQYRHYAEELRNWRDDLAKAIASDLSGLRAEKADRAQLARLLSEVGDRLSGTAAEPTRH